jgi:hypothetical protein
VGSDILRIVLVAPGSGSRVLEKVDEDIRFMEEKKGVKVAGSQSASFGREGYRKTLYDDGTVSFVQFMSEAVLQVVTKNQGAAETYFRNNGLIVDNPKLLESSGWVSGSKLTFLIPFLLVYAVFWVIGILKGGTLIAAVDPTQGAGKIPLDELKNRLLQVNQFDVPFTVKERSRNILTAEWRLDAKWQGIIENERIEHAITLDMKLDERRGTVSVIEHKKKVIKEKGIFSLKAQLEYFRGITFKSYEAGVTYGLSYVDGEYKVTGYRYRFNVQEMKNPLIEVVTRSGWKWQPCILFL